MIPAHVRPFRVLLPWLLLAACGNAADMPPTETSAPPPVTSPDDRTADGGNAAAAEASPPVPASGNTVPVPDATDDVRLADHNVAHAIVEERFVTEPLADFGFDSIAMWQAPVGGRWLYVSAKDVDRVAYFDGETGILKGSIGGSGAAAGELSGPSGVFVIDDLLLVVERGNHRVQVFALPALRPIGDFGASQLRQPRGIWARRHADGYQVIVSDAYTSPDEPRGIPPLDQLGERFRRFQMRVDGESLVVEPADAFGDRAAGAIRVADSLAGDEVLQRLLIAEQDQGSGTRLKVYHLEGEYADLDVGAEQFRAQAGGIALFSCPDGRGYWIAADRFLDRSLFHLFDRQTLAHVGSFAGKTTANADSIWLSQSPTEAFPLGVLYAVHDDRAVAAFDWGAIASAVGISGSCAA